MSWLKLPGFSRAEIVFSLKTFVAAMLAMYLANRAGLPRPFWALLTVYIVSNPLAGAVRSKAAYRFTGTLVGSTAAVLLVPALSNSPELLVLALALWVGVCLFISLLDRTPRAYLFMLAGYTAALIAFPSVQAPLQLFDSAVARVEEIGLAIVCATLMHSLVLPTGMAPTIIGLLDRTLGHARQWMQDVFSAEQGAQASAHISSDRRRIAGDITQLRVLSTHVPFDATHFRWTAGALEAMQDRVAALTPILSAVEDRLHALEQAQGQIAPDIRAVLDQLRQWIEHENIRPRLERRDDEASAADRLREQIQALAQAEPAPGRPANEAAWLQALRIGLARGLQSLLKGWQDCAALRREIDAGLTGQATQARRASFQDKVLHHDYGMAFLSALAAVLAISLCSLFWVMTGWSAGSGAAMMAAVFCSFFATMDDPVPAIHNFLKFTLASIPLSTIYVLVLLPLVQDFGMLVLICAPLFLLMGALIARPAAAGASMAFLFGVVGTLSMHDTATADLASFVNSMTAQVLGIIAASRVTALIRSVGADWSARRIQRHIWRELADMASVARAPAALHTFAARMLDRTALLAPRLAQINPTGEHRPATDALQDLRIGADIVVLQGARGQLPEQASAQLLSEVAGFFHQLSSKKRWSAPTDALLAGIDRTLSSALQQAQPAHADWHAAVAALVGLRRNLFPQAPMALSRAEESPT